MPSSFSSVGLNPLFSVIRGGDRGGDRGGGGGGGGEEEGGRDGSRGKR